MEIFENSTSAKESFPKIIFGKIKNDEVFLLPENYASKIFASKDIFSASETNKDKIDILEQNIWEISPNLLNLLLKDKTTGKNIKWACDEYAKYGKAYTAEKEILAKQIIGRQTKIIQPRISKSKDEQKNRTQKAAEVFTPSWICNEMNNHCDEEWFGRKDVFNTPNGHDWTVNKEPIQFDKDGKKTWKKYVDSKRLEITCGEAPYLVSRYDTTTGAFLSIEKRIGILDRKLRIVNENTTDEKEWFKWTRRAFEATYGYEYQGDNLLLARENLLWTFVDYFYYRHRKQPAIAQMKQIANIIVWNIWQMDGLKDSVPFGDVEKNPDQLELFNDLPKVLVPTLCKIRDWRSERTLYFQDLKGDKHEV